MDPFECPVCQTKAVTVRFTGLIVQDADGNETLDLVSFDIDPNAPATCTVCGHTGTATTFTSTTEKTQP